MSTNLLFAMELLPALRRQCHAAVCVDDFIDGFEDVYINKGDIKIDHILNKDVLDKNNVFVVYSEVNSEPMVGDFGGVGNLLRGGVVRNATSDVQVTVYSQIIKYCYVVGDAIMKSFDEAAMRRQDFRYFRLLGRSATISEEVGSWAVIYKFRVQLEPLYINENEE